VRLAILAIGKMKDGPERELQARYLERARATGRALGIFAIDIVELSESRATRAPDRKSDEARDLLARAGEGVVIALDEKGTSPTSEGFAAFIEGALGRGDKNLNFIIGGADGLSDEILARADKRIAFGAMTMPHQLARVLLIEQVYRAMTLMSGHPYHRA
jgi:23S rRNA (pseudouridine1915-N3)-methyltransferase